MKFTSIFFKTNESILEFYLKDTNKRVRNMKFTSIFFKMNESILDFLLPFPCYYTFHFTLFILHKVARTNAKVKSYIKEK